MDTIEKVAGEGSIFFVQATFYDENNVLFIPDECFWKLTDLEGNIINEREDIEITGGDLLSTVTIALSGNDLLTFSGSMAARLITLYGQYTSTTVGGLVPFRKQALFHIEPEIGLN